MSKCMLCGKSGLFLKTNVEGMCPDCQKRTLQYLRESIRELQASLTPEQQDINKLTAEIQRLNLEKTKLNNEIAQHTNSLAKLSSELQSKKQQVIETDEVILLQSFGLYEPKYDFVNSEQYKQRLDEIRKKQKDMIKNNSAVSGNQSWQVDGSVAKGKAMVNNLQKLLLRAFNSECDEIINKVRYSNYDTSVKRIKSSREAISKLGFMLHIVITEPYFKLKLQELDLAFEYQQMKQKEKEEQRELKAQLREEAKLQKELEIERKVVEKQQNHYLNALEKVNKQLLEQPDNQEILERKKILEENLAQTEQALKNLDYREANKRAGYVYIISNIGAFGENVYKIGMTRRLDPQERVDELGDASVPFRFDVHAMIFSEDAPALENALHHAFEDKRLNKVNTRKEFFNVTLDEIKEVVKANYDKTAEFIESPEAEQYRVSLKL